MAMGLGYHRESQARLAQVTKDNQAAAPVISSAGALVNGLKVIGAKRIALVAPYMKPLTQLVVDYIQHEGIEVKVARAGDPGQPRSRPARSGQLPGIVAEMDLREVDAIVLSACVQMPSLPAVPTVEAQTGKPVITAAIATTYAMLTALELEPIVPGAGALPSGAY
ncbi:hypothetical protein M8494_11920 [Serratia ureilytica]